MTHPLAFTGKQVTKLTGLPAWTLAYWEKTGVYAASYTDVRPRVPYRRIYDFRDLVSLRTLAQLRDELSLAELRKAGHYLATAFPEVENPWAEMSFGIVNQQIVLRNPTSGAWQGTDGQQVLSIVDLDAIAKAAERDDRTLMKRPSDDVGRVVRHRHVLRNAWRLAGTRIPTSAIWAFCEAGSNVAEILREYPDLQVPDVVAAVEHERALRGLSAA